MFYTITNVNESVDFLSDAQEVDFKHEANLEGALMNIYESEVNWNSLMKAVAMDELTHFVENGEMAVYEGARLDSFFAKMKEFFKSLWTKIQGFFNKFFAMIAQFVLTDKAFVKKYEKALRDKTTTGFEYKGYEFTNLDDSNEMKQLAAQVMNSTQRVKDAKDLEPKSVEEIKAITKSLGENETKINDGYRGKMVKKSSVEYDDYAKELYMYFRKGEDSPSTISGVNIDAQIKYISDAKDNIKAAKEDMNIYKKSINDVIDALNKAEKALGSADKEEDKAKNSAISSCILKSIASTKSMLSIAQTYSGAKVSALKARNRQAKSVCVKVLSYKHEGVDLSSYEEGSLVNQVNFI